MILGDTYMRKNQKWKGELQITKDYSMPMYVICGAEEGKTLVITSGVHGCEYVGVQTARRLWKILDPKEIKGRVIILPLVNANGFYEGAKQIMPEDGENLNRMFPGKAEGSLSQQVAYVMEQEIYPKADFILDLHGGDCNEAMTPLVFFPVAAESSVNEAARKAASCLPVEYRVASTARNGLYSYATQKGIPSLLLEIGGEGKWLESEVTLGEACAFSLMEHLGLVEEMQVEGEAQLAQGIQAGQEMQLEQGIQVEQKVQFSQKEITKAVYEEAQESGFWYSKVKPGQVVSKGDLLGVLCDLEDEILQECRAQMDGEVLYYTIALGIKKGDSLITYGTV